MEVGRYSQGAKKPMVDIKEALEPAFQLRRYAYTPQYIVDYIVENTVGALLNHPHRVKKDRATNLNRYPKFLEIP